MKLWVKIALSSVLIVLFGILIIPLFFDNSSLKVVLQQKLSQRLGASFNIEGELKVALFPLPKIIISELKVDNLKYQDHLARLSAPRVIIYPGFSSLIGGQMKINKILFREPSFNLYRPEIAASSRVNDIKPQLSVATGGISSAIFDVNKLQDEDINFKKIAKIVVENGYFSKRDLNDKLDLEFSKISLTALNKSDEQVVQGLFYSAQIPTEFKIIADTSKGGNSVLSVISPIIKLNIEGEFANANLDKLIISDFNGKVDAEIIDLRTVLNKYFSDNNLIFDKIGATQPMKISGDISGKGGKVQTNNLVVTSSIINGRGKVAGDFTGSVPELEVDLEVDNINVNGLWISNAARPEQNIIDTENKILNDFINISASNTTGINETLSSSTFKITSNIKIKQAKYGDVELKEIELNLTTADNGDITLSPSAMKVGKDGLLKIEGSLGYEMEVPKFRGKFELSGADLQPIISYIKIAPDNLKPGVFHDYFAKGDLLLLPDFIVCNNIYLSINGGRNLIIGNLKSDNLSDFSKVEANFRVSDLNLEDYLLLSEENSYLYRGSLLKKLLWLNTLSSDINLYIIFDKVTYKDKIFYNQPIKFNLGEGYFKINDLTLAANGFDLRASLAIDISGDVPDLKLSLSGKQLTINDDDFDTISDDIDEVEENDNKQDDKSAKENKENNIETKTFSLTKRFFDLVSLDGFKGSLDLDLQQLLIGELEINNLKLNTSLEQGAIDLSNVEFGIFDGSAKYNGSVTLKKSKIINGSFDLNNINSQLLLDYLLDLSNISGVANLSGTLASSGESKEEFLKNLDTQLKFSAVQAKIEGFGVDYLAGEMLWPLKYYQELLEPQTILFGENYSSFFQEVRGSLAILGNKKNQLKIETKSLGINSLTNGSLDIDQKNINASSQFVFVVGTKKKQIPITVAINFSGPLDNLVKVPNLDQVNQYMQMFSGLVNKNNESNSAGSGVSTIIPATAKPADTSGNARDSGNNPPNNQQAPASPPATQTPTLNMPSSFGTRPANDNIPAASKTKFQQQINQNP